MGIYYVYDPINGQVDRELDDDGNVLVEYTREPDGTLISEHRNGVSRQYHFDGDGNTLALTDDNGDVTDTFAYNHDGEVTERTGTTPTPYQFHGLDGLYKDLGTGDFMDQGRPMSPNDGRWLAPEQSNLSRGFNSYPFLLNPVAIPFSLFPVLPFIAAELIQDKTEKPKDPKDLSPFLCECNETRMAKTGYALDEAIVDKELDVNFDGFEPNKDGTPKAIKRKMPLKATGMDTIRVIIRRRNYGVVCCTDKTTKKVRMRHSVEIGEPFNRADNAIVVLSPPKPPTTTNMRKIVEYVFPVPYWAVGDAEDSDIVKCLRQVKDVGTGPHKTVPKGNYDEP